MLSHLAQFGGACLALALPPRCPGCGVVVPGDHRFCLTCWVGLDFLGGPACMRCAMPFPDEAVGVLTCAPCLARPPAFDHASAAVAYGPIARALALKLKYGRRPGVARTMARLMERLVPAGEDVVLVPVPLHRWRIWTRGFNQSALIAQTLARRRGSALAIDAIERHRRTPPLRDMNPRQRAMTVRGAFRVRDPAQVAGRRVVLIDDIFTTGATAEACARVLRRAGAAEVRLVCWARVVVRDGDPVR
ncbi:double zinc ribbon domain-containing protein [Sphingomonas montana]|uniref:double zinc ribbon domain-containing protein n=1 Tax=Sphingomonas montana TaxID=1843236 RepID=UPI003B837466